MTEEEAREATVTLSQALQELAAHNVTGEALAEFFADCGRREHYCGAAVLDWLGY